MTPKCHVLATLLFAGIVIPAAAVGAQSLRGSRASVERMHGHAVRQGLHFYQTSAGVRRAVKGERLVRLAGNADYSLHRVRFPYAATSTRTFVERLAAQYRQACGERLVLTGAVRAATQQPWNASRRSVHPTGIAVDVRRPVNGKCGSWLRSTLLALEGARVIEATEEYGPPHFHVAVYPSPYLRYVSRVTSARVAVNRRSTHVVRAGDTLWRIARRYDTTVHRLMEANDLHKSAITPDQSLLVPGRDGPGKAIRGAAEW